MKSITQRCTPAVFLIMSESLGIIQISHFPLASSLDLTEIKIKALSRFLHFGANVSQLGKF